MKNLIVLLILPFLMSGCLPRNQRETEVRHIGLQPDGSMLTASNQLLKPAGFQVNFPGRPVDLDSRVARRLMPFSEWLAGLPRPPKEQPW